MPRELLTGNVPIKAESFVHSAGLTPCQERRHNRTYATPQLICERLMIEDHAIIVPKIWVDFGSVTRIDRGDLKPLTLRECNQLGAFVRAEYASNREHSFANALTLHAG